MLKTVLHTLFLLGIAQFAHAQAPTLTSATVDPVANEAFILKVCDTSTVMPGPGGMSQTWNFTALSVTQTDTGKSVSCLALPPGIPSCGTFPGSNLVLSGHGLIDAHNYIATSTTKRSQVGYWAAADTMLVMSDPMDELHYPFTYPNTFNDPFDGVLTLGTLSAHHTGTITVTADGYGTLNLPGRSDNVLRVHSSQTYKDSANLFGTPIVVVYDVNTYSWYKTGYHSALLTIATAVPVGPAPTGPQKIVTYAPQQIADVQILTGAVTAFDLYPNPASDILHISFEPMDNAQASIMLIDALGRQQLIASGNYSGAQNISFNTASLPKGVYLVRLQCGAETLTRKVVLQ
jgi:hypothetical protein